MNASDPITESDNVILQAEGRPHMAPDGECQPRLPRCRAHVACGRSAASLGAATVNPELLTAAERIQYEGYLRREEANAAILGLAREGAAIKEIVRRTGHSRGLVRKVLRGQRADVFRVRESSLEVHLPWLEAQWTAGRRNGAELWRRLRQHGFRGSLRVVTEWATRRRKAEQAEAARWAGRLRHGRSPGF